MLESGTQILLAFREISSLVEVDDAHSEFHPMRHSLFRPLTHRV